eukprot:TRINITY_DN4874_c0_g1_i3.p1 TRINITY_DN4874_c0_g1~~TRINITY_DN4874_c0_g1_i3.p1  ORF type:complete len:353 (-),score=89.57 TRINITY_DN4874_c0_g1_i3:7-1065(-)
MFHGPTASGDCYWPYQPPACTETIGAALGWQTAVFQACWVLVWVPLCGLVWRRTWERGIHAACTICGIGGVLALLMVVRSVDPRGMRDIYGPDDFVTGSAMGVLTTMAIFELGFLLLSILSGLHEPPNKEAALLVRIWEAQRLSPKQQRIRAAAHLGLTAMFFAGAGAKKLWQQAVGQIVWTAVTAGGALAVFVRIVAIRRRLERSAQLHSAQGGASTARILAHSRRFTRLFAVIAVALLIWAPLWLAALAKKLEDRTARHPLVRREQAIGDVIVASFPEMFFLVEVACIWYFFLRSAEPSTPGSSTPGTQTGATPGATQATARSGVAVGTSGNVSMMEIPERTTLDGSTPA